MSQIITLEQAVEMSKTLVDHVKGMTSGKAFLTGEYADLYVLDHLLSPHYGTSEPDKDLADFALASGIYTAVLVARMWREAGLESIWREGELTECGIETRFPGVNGKEQSFFLAAPSDVYALVLGPPDPFPLFADGWVPLRKGDGVLPKYGLGGLCLNQPLARGDWDKTMPEPGSFRQGHQEAMLSLVALSCARDLVREAGLEQRVLEVFYECCLWPPLGAQGNDLGLENVKCLAGQVAHAGPENRKTVMETLDRMERAWVSEGAYLAGLVSRALSDRDDPPAEKVGLSVPECREALEEAKRIIKEKVTE
jgi:hypothetical protein